MGDSARSRLCRALPFFSAGSPLLFTCCFTDEQDDPGRRARRRSGCQSLNVNAQRGRLPWLLGPGIVAAAVPGLMVGPPFGPAEWAGKGLFAKISQLQDVDCSPVLCAGTACAWARSACLTVLVSGGLALAPHAHRFRVASWICSQAGSQLHWQRFHWQRFHLHIACTCV